MYVRFPLLLRNVEDLLFERGMDICHERVSMWWTRFGPLFAREIRRQRLSQVRGFRHWRWHAHPRGRAPGSPHTRRLGRAILALWRRATRGRAEPGRAKRASRRPTIGAKERDGVLARIDIQERASRKRWSRATRRAAYVQYLSTAKRA